MKTPRTQIAQVIAKRTLKGATSKKFNTEIAAYLLHEKRVGELDSLLRDVQLDWAMDGRVEVIASSAHALSTQVKTDITQQVKKLYPQAKQIIITENFDPAIIGGVRLSLPNQQLDLSIEAKLNKFRQLTTTGKD